MRKALVIGIDYYSNSNTSQLYGCVNDAHEVKNILEKHGDGSVNFGVKLLTASSDKDAISKYALKDNVEELFKGDSDIALLYFAGHGFAEVTGGYLCGSDSVRGDDGLSLTDVMTYATNSKAKNKILVLDSCFSGIAGAAPTSPDAATLAEGMTILTASTADQYASEENSGGVYTGLFVDALSGAACNLVGDITPGSVYAHIDQSLGPWKQRPVFKTNVKTFVSLRKVQAPIDLADLLRLTEFFPNPGYQYQLDPSFEPELAGRPEGVLPPNPDNCAKFAILQKYRDVNLVRPVDAPHMWHAAMQSKSCKLTVLGEHYRRLINDKLI